MTHVKGFASFEDALKFMADATDAANKNLAPEQRAITWGSYWLRFAPEYHCVIFGRVMPMEELIDSEREAGAEPEELDYTREHYTEQHERGYLFGYAYSVMEPRGELGDTHRANMWPITQEQFEHAKDAEWELRHVIAEWPMRVLDDWTAHQMKLQFGP